MGKYKGEKDRGEKRTKRKRDVVEKGGKRTKGEKGPRRKRIKGKRTKGLKNKRSKGQLPENE